jgi:hypothetical protein
MEIKIEENDIIDLGNENGGCTKCKNKLSNTQKWMIVLSIYIMSSCIYGTYKLIELMGTLF